MYERLRDVDGAWDVSYSNGSGGTVIYSFVGAKPKVMLMLYKQTYVGRKCNI